MSKIPTIKFRDNKIETIMEGLKQNNISTLLRESLLASLKIAISKNKKECEVCYVGELSVSIPYSSYKTVLSGYEKYYSDNNQFEKCAEIRDLKLKIKDEQE